MMTDIIVAVIFIILFLTLFCPKRKSGDRFDHRQNEQIRRMHKFDER